VKLINKRILFLQKSKIQPLPSGFHIVLSKWLSVSLYCLIHSLANLAKVCSSSTHFNQA